MSFRYRYFVLVSESILQVLVPVLQVIILILQFTIGVIKRSQWCFFLNLTFSMLNLDLVCFEYIAHIDPDQLACEKLADQDYH